MMTKASDIAWQNTSMSKLEIFHHRLHMTEKENSPKTRFFTVAKWPHPWPPPGGIRHLIFHAKTNGFNQVIKRVGRTVLIDEAAFFLWVEQNNASKDMEVDNGK